MNTASIFIKTEPKIKEEAEKTAEELGFSLSSILNAFLRQFVKTKTITFSAK
jgi:addiction module RelB/DinJ family antitoxin